jgi:hypothetical protein
VSARERVRALRRQRIGEERPLAPEAELHPVRQHLRTEEGERHEHGVRSLAPAPEDAGREQCDHKEGRGVSEPGDSAEDIGQRLGRAPVEPLGEPLVVRRVVLEQVFRERPERPHGRDEHQEGDHEGQTEGAQPRREPGFAKWQSGHQSRDARHGDS